MDRIQEKWFLILLQVLLGLAVFSLFIPSVTALPQDKTGLIESYSDDQIPMYDENGIRIRTKSEKNVKMSGEFYDTSPKSIDIIPRSTRREPIQNRTNR